MRHHSARPALALAVFLIGVLRSQAGAAANQPFAAGSLIVPMDLAYQDRGLFQAYGLLFQLLRHGIPVSWVIHPDKTWHTARCDNEEDPCPWDCAIEGSGDKCPYPTASPDFYTSAKVLWDDSGLLASGATIDRHGYRGGPFVISAAHSEAAKAVIAAWNDQTRWTANPWAARSVFRVVSVHEATAAFEGFVTKEMIAAPTIAVFSDGNEDIATSYLRAAGIPQSNGEEFPDGKCGAANCGPGTNNPDMLTVQSIMGDMGTCDDLDTNHKNGALFTADGLPAYCQVMSMHWNVGDRETVECGGRACPSTPAECAGQKITYHGHEVVAEVRSFLQYPTHFFAECQAVNAYENTTPNPAWPFADDLNRDGHFLTTSGTPPPCPCSEEGFSCVPGGCDGNDCCLPKDAKERGAGFLIAAQPSGELKILRPNVPYNQLDGAFDSVGGSEPAYNLSSYLETKYKNDREVTFITGAEGPGLQDVWMTGYVDGQCDIGCLPGEEFCVPRACSTSGKVSYLGGHKYGTNVPLSSNSDAQGTRLFLNALFEADCVTSAGQPDVTLTLTGEVVVAARTLPVERDYHVTYANRGAGAALSATIQLAVPDGAAVTQASDNGTVTATETSWSIGSISGAPRATDPPNSGTRTAVLRFSGYGQHTVTVGLSYRVGASELQAPPAQVTIAVLPDRDGDAVPDERDPFPDDPSLCGDQDRDTCDDCSGGAFDPLNDGPDSDGDGLCDAGDDAGPTSDADVAGTERDRGCSCGLKPRPSRTPIALTVLCLGLPLTRRRRHRRRT